MQICELPRGGQLSFHGNVFNVPADVSSTVLELLHKRPINESKTTPIKLKRISSPEWICSSCHSNLTEGKLPASSKPNKMHFPKKNSFGRTLNFFRIPFMQICELPRGGQLSFHGNVFNMPADVSSTVLELLHKRPINESKTTPIKLKRILSPESTFLLVSTKNTDSGHFQGRKSANHGLPARLRTLRYLKRQWL